MTTAVLGLIGAVGLAGIAHAQAPAAPPAPPPGIYCGGPPANNTRVPDYEVSQCEVDKVLGAAGNGLQLIRLRTLIFGIVPRPVWVGVGSVVDIEANPAGQPMANARFEYAPDFRQAALRYDVTPASGNRIIRVVKGNKAWDEGPTPGMNPKDVTDAKAIAIRQAMLWANPHAIVRAAAFTSKGLCPTTTDGKIEKCPDNKVSIEGDKVINLTLYGNTYKVTLDAQNRPATIATTIPGVGPFVATFSGYRDGKGMTDPTKGNPGAELIGTVRGDTLDKLAFATDVLDKYRYGLYYPGHVVHSLNGKTVLDVEVKAGFTNKYVIFPDPELLRTASK
jgi:hypothetical protein